MSFDFEEYGRSREEFHDRLAQRYARELHAARERGDEKEILRWRDILFITAISYTAKYGATGDERTLVWISFAARQHLLATGGLPLVEAENDVEWLSSEVRSILERRQDLPVLELEDDLISELPNLIPD